MSLLDRVRECNAHDLSDCLPFEVAGQRVGWVKREFAAHLAPFAEVFAVRESRVSLSPDLSDFESRTAAVAPVVRRLAEDGVVTGWRDELYPACPAFDQPALFYSPETGEQLAVDPAGAQEAFEEVAREFVDEVRQGVIRFGGRYLPVPTDRDLAHVVRTAILDDVLRVQGGRR